MAKATAKQEEPAATPIRKKNSKKMLFVAIAAIVVLVAGGGAAAYIIKHRQAAEDGPAAKESSKKSGHDVPPMFVRLEPFTVNLQADGESQAQYLQVTPELRVLDNAASDKVKVYMPEIRHKTLLLLSSKRASEISTPQGVEQLSLELREQINLILDGGAAKPGGQITPVADPGDPTQAVLFTAFIIQ